MTAVKLRGIQNLQVERAPVPKIGNDEILVKVHCGFICGTDLRMYKNGHSHAELDNGLVLGHEIAGIVAEVGRSVGQYREGMRVSVDPNMGCGVCNRCVSGHTQLCGELQALGINIDGGFAEYIRIPREAVLQGNVAVIPDHVSFEEAALAEPLSCVLNAAERCRTQPGDVVLVIGAGPIGMMHGRVQRMLGAGTIIVHDLNEQRLVSCHERNPDFTVVGEHELDQVILQHTDGRGADVCVVAAPSPEAQQRGLELLGINGRLMLFGGLPKDREVVPFNSNLIHYKQLIVTGTTRQNLRQYRTCIDLIARGKLGVKDIVTHVFNLADAPEAFEQAIAGIGLKLGFSISGDAASG